ncbi:RodZ family helix-turn-helix domain-containing protein [Halobacteriovorax sp. HLS]|uniref:helix-turn-helix domain-containing protein n=1 Tax=Halobacteriovorax sp. HLS TaxID=2234000 RepID=UPI000FDAD8A2|nr:helix-turn-helix transcriptional regulator [Halobacteriovorax sp. HLS]
MEKSKNYYDVLEISNQANQEDIQQGYIRAKNAYSQDSLALYSIMTKDECDQILNLIEEAYSIISDPMKRQQYDEARGLNKDFNYYTPNTSTVLNQRSDSADSKLDKALGTSEKPSGESMTKIVATKKYSLAYEENPEMEEKISQATEFTGEFLREIREYKKVDIIRMAEMTKVSKTYLKYIEDEAINKLPALVYVRGFVFQYAKCLKLNPDIIATSYLNRIKELKG